jgi:hypothetical protein
MHLFGIDPGEHVGWCFGILDEGVFTVQNVQEWTPKQLYDWMKENLNPEFPGIIVCEDYRIDPRPKAQGGSGYNHQWDKGITLRQIGALGFLCQVNGWEFVLQPNYRKPAGYGFLGMKYVRGKKGAHATDALAHLAFYGVERRLWGPNIRETAPEPHAQPVSNHPKYRTQSVKLWRSARKQP